MATKTIVATKRAAPVALAARPSAGRVALLEEMGADAARPKSADAAKEVLKRVGEMVRTRSLLEAAAEKAEEELKRRKADLFRMDTVDLPTLLQEAGLQEIALEDGTKVEIKDDINCSITDDRRPEAHAWMRKNGAGGLIKMAVIATFGKDQIEKADALYLALVKKLGDGAVEQKETVHSATLKSWIKECIARQAEEQAAPRGKVKAAERVKVPPFPLFGVHPYMIAKVSAAKAKGSAAQRALADARRSGGRVDGRKGS